MDYKPRQSYKGSSYTYKKKRIFWFNSAFNDDFTLVDGKIDDITFNVPQFQTYKNNNLKLLTFVREDTNAKPIIIKLKEPYLTSRSVINTDKENYPIIYANHTGCEGMTSKGNNFDLTPQQIPKFVFKFDDTINKLTYNSYFSSITNGSLSQVVGGSPDDKILIFNSSGSFVLSRNLTCDILIVGGGGGGGFFGGGGGAGQVLYTTNLNLSLGSYTITVGSGGAGSSTNSSNGTNGGDSSITIGGITYTAKGGGGGGTRDAGSVGRAGNAGGSGGGGSHSDSSTAINVGGSSTKNDYSNWISLGNSGGDGKDGNDGGYGHAGGGGSGSKGSNGLINGGGNGGMGINLSSIFGSSIGQAGWFGGGGGGTGYSGISNATIGFGNGGNGLFGGGGNGSLSNVSGGNGLANTGGGGGGCDIYTTGGTGGSGVVIIKFRETRINGITPVETLVQATNSSITVVENSKYLINYQNPTNIPTGTYETIFSNGGITFNSKTFKSYPDAKDINNQVIIPYVWYKFDNNENQMLNDSGIFGFNLTNGNATFDNTTFQKGNGSLNIALDNYVEITNPIDFRTIQITNGLSFSLWIRMSSTTGLYGRIFDFSGSSTIIAIHRNNGSDNISFLINTSVYTTTGTNYFNDTWYHIVWSISSSGVWNIYINGVKLSVSITYSIPSGQTFNTLKRIGKSYDVNLNDRSVGKFDDFRIYNVSLTDRQARQIYDGDADRSYPILKDANGDTINPYVWYKLDANDLLIDSSGNNNHLVKVGTGGASNTTIFVKGDGSAYFNGSGNYFRNSISFAGRDVPISFSFWFNPTASGAEYTLVSLNNNAGFGTIQFDYYLSGNTLTAFTALATQWSTSPNKTGLATNTWHHVVYTLNNNNPVGVKLYVNGVLATSGTGNLNQTLNANRNFIYLGFSGDYGRGYNGYIDDFRMYALELSATQVSELYNGRVSIYNPPNFEIGLEMNDVDLVPDNTISPYK